VNPGSREGSRMKYYQSHEECYRRIKEKSLSSWGEFCEQSETFEDFYMKEYIW
jgi:hypothetical protein